MKPTVLGRLLTAGLLLGAAVAGAATNSATAPQTDEQIVRSIRHEILMYPNYTIWDDVNFRVANGQVELLGAVNQPYKKSDLQRMVQRVPGVTSVSNELKVLPLSPNDDRLRIQVARAIFRDPVFTRYAMQAVPPIHIIVDNGHVTLEGTVATEMEKQIAGMRASGAGLSFGPVVNNLQVENRANRKG
jgi:hyperosmotically inducible protein